MDYEYVEYVLANYLASGIGQSEDEAISSLRADMQNNAEFCANLRTELEEALSDDQFSWMSALKDHDVAIVGDEKTARLYVNRLLWESLFEV